MVSVLSSSVVDVDSSLDRVKPNIRICCFSTKHASLRRKSKDWLARNQNNVFDNVGRHVLSADCCFSELAL